jgi:ribosomal protein S18 acetylase RimI-like enzyme
MQLRPVTHSDDLASIQELEKAARSRYPDDPNFAFASASPPIARERLEAGELVIAVDDGRIVGFILTTPMDSGLYIVNISVAAGCSGRGIGAALMQDALRRAGVCKLYEVMLTTFRTPKWNGPWFRRFGFTPMPEEHIGIGLREVLERQAKFVDPATRETLWKMVGGQLSE